MKRHILHKDTLRSRWSLLAALSGGIFLFILVIILLKSSLSPYLITAKAPNASTGTYVNVSNSTMYWCNVSIPAGTSMVSFPCLPPNIGMSTFIQGFDNESVEVVYRYTPGSTSKWLVYNGSLPSYAQNTLSGIGKEYGYYVVLSQQDRFQYEGILASTSTTLLQPGWNLVGYGSNRTQNLTESLASINDTYNTIKTLQTTEEAGVYLVNSSTLGTLNNTSAYKAYWIDMDAQDIWVVVQ